MKKSLVLAVAVLLTVGIGYEVQKNLKSDSKSSSAPSANVSASAGKDAAATKDGVAPAPGDAPLVNPGQVAANLNSGESSGAANPSNSGAQSGAGNQTGMQTSGANSGAAGSANSANLSKNAINDKSGTVGSLPGASAPGNLAAGSVSKNTSAPAAAAVAPEKPKDNCFSYEYRHKKSAKSRDIEEFLDLTNAFAILHPNYNPDTLCVKVNSKPENFTTLKTKNGSEVRLGSVVGPESVIHVSYCVGKVTCKESCAAPKKRFMDDLMSDAGDEDTFNDSWGKGDDAHKKELKNKAKELRAVASESQNLNEGSVIREWDTLQKQEWVCKESQKRKEK